MRREPRIQSSSIFLQILLLLFSLMLEGCSRPQLNLTNRRKIDNDYEKPLNVNKYFGSIKGDEKLKLPEIKNIDQSNGIKPHNFIFSNDGSGNYYFSFNTFSLSRLEVGELKNAGTDNEIQAVKGQYETRTVAKNGLHIIRRIGYVADENGFQPVIINLKMELAPSTAAALTLPQYEVSKEPAVDTTTEIPQFTTEEVTQLPEPKKPIPSEIGFRMDNKEEKKEGISSACITSLCGGNIG